MRYGLESLARPATNKFSVLLCCSVDNFAHFSGSAPPFPGCDNSRTMRTPLDSLTPRVREVLALIGRGLPTCHSELAARGEQIVPPLAGAGGVARNLVVRQ